MSAVFGILRFDGRAVSPRDLDRMADTLAYRGPDGRKVLVDGPMGLGHCLMRVNREDRFEAQPLRHPGRGVLLVADARLDNREELAAAFGIPPADLGEVPDSALIMHAYGTWGEDCARHLLGDFAFAVWDPADRKLVLARDHMGQRYIHYHRGQAFFAFATDVKALWTQREVPRVLSDVTIGRMLLSARPNGATPFEGIGGLPGATVMTVSQDGSVEQHRYWEPRADPAHEGRDEAYYIAAYRRVLGEAVACRIRRASKPPGLLFSGGYDSAAIAGLAGPVLAASGRRLVAAASVMPADYQGTIRHARRWVEMCARDMPHLDVRYVTREGKSVLTGLEQAFGEGDSPTGAYHFVNTDLMAQVAEAGARVVMDGHGGDYTLHPRGQAALARLLKMLRLRRFLREFRWHVRMTGESSWSTLGGLVATALPQPLVTLWRRRRQGFAPSWSRHPIDRAFARRLLDDGAIRKEQLRTATRPPVDMGGKIARTLQRVGNTTAPGRSITAALHGLELTRPFHDKRVVELALAVPQDLYVKNGRNRYLACAALADVYPPEFQTRWRKNDDEIPDFQRMAKAIEPQLLEEVARMERSANLSRYIDFSRLRALLAARGPDDHNSGGEPETQMALQGFVTARYVEWFRRYNR